MSDFISVAKLTDVPSGEGRVVEAGEVAIALFNIDGTFHALDNTCLHRGGPLGDGICVDGTGTILACKESLVNTQCRITTLSQDRDFRIC